MPGQHVNAGDEGGVASGDEACLLHVEERRRVDDVHTALGPVDRLARLVEGKPQAATLRLEARSHRLQEHHNRLCRHCNGCLRAAVRHKRRCVGQQFEEGGPNQADSFERIAEQRLRLFARHALQHASSTHQEMGIRRWQVQGQRDVPRLSGKEGPQLLHRARPERAAQHRQASAGRQCPETLGRARQGRGASVSPTEGSTQPLHALGHRSRVIPCLSRRCMHHRLRQRRRTGGNGHTGWAGRRQAGDRRKRRLWRSRHRRDGRRWRSAGRLSGRLLILLDVDQRGFPSLLGVELAVELVDVADAFLFRR